MSKRAETAVVIVAAGRGTRAGGGVPKQWRRLAGRPVRGGWPTKITELDDTVGGVAWSPDGAWLAAVAT